MTGGHWRNIWRNMEPIDTTIQRYVQPMFSQLQLTVGIKRSEGEERKRTPLLASSANSLFSKGSANWLIISFSLCYLSLRTILCVIFHNAGWLNIIRLKTRTYLRSVKSVKKVFLRRYVGLRTMVKMAG